MRNYTLVYVWNPEVSIGEIGYFEQLRKYQVRCRVYVFRHCLLTGRCVSVSCVCLCLWRCVSVFVCTYARVSSVSCVCLCLWGCVSVFTYEFTSQSHEVYLVQFFFSYARDLIDHRPVHTFVGSVERIAHALRNQ